MRIGIQRLGTAENISLGEIFLPGYADRKNLAAAALKKLKRFERMINLLHILSDREVIEVQQAEDDGLSKSYLMIAEKVPEDLRPLLGELRQLIGLSNRNRFRITDRVTNIGVDEISIQTHSIMAMLRFMSRGVEVPLEHLREGRVADYGLQNRKGEVAVGLIPFRIRSSKARPQNAFAAVRFHNYWYYIDQDDIASKRALILIIVLFRLQAPTPAGAAPILTLPTG